MGGLLGLPSLEWFCGGAGPEEGGNKQQHGIKQPPSIPLAFPLHSWLQTPVAGCAFPVPDPAAALASQGQSVEQKKEDSDL